MKEKILNALTTECPWRDTLYWYDTVDSTNTLAKQLAKEGAAHGTVLIAGAQSAGRGRLGRSFSSPAGMGVYLSVILRPGCKPEELMHLTCAAGLAACDGVNRAAGILPEIKWANDLVFEGRKLGGILTELGIDSASGTVEYGIIGIGINCNQAPQDFPEEISGIATSLKMITGASCSPAHLAASLVETLFEMSQNLFSGGSEIMSRYRERCITVGKDVQLIRGEDIRYGTALDVDDQGGLLVRFRDGSVETVSSGEISIRGMYGYL